MAIVHFGCEGATRRILDVNGLRLHALEAGRGNPATMLFLHGGSAHAHWFDRVMPAFVERFHALALDQRGHGESEWPVPAAYGTDDFVADLAGALDALGWERTIVVGHSMGGHNAMAFAAAHPERVRALVIGDSRPAIPPERLRHMQERGGRAPRRHPSAEAAVQSFRLIPRETVADPAFLAHLARAGLARRDGGWAYRFDPACNGTRTPRDVWPLLRRITAPTLIVRGEWSPIMPAETAERMRAAIPRASVVTLAGAHHHITLDQPAAFVAAVTAFLDGIAD
jgi:pimeloyl-ACP methyl ester carboxylesterase